jgi:hypothetical protein
MKGIPGDIRGFWSLWRISIIGEDLHRYRIMPLFISDDSKVYTPTARHIWDQLLISDLKIDSYLESEKSKVTYEQSRAAAEEYGKLIYEALLNEHRSHIERNREKAQHAFDTKRKIIEKIGLPQVCNHRLELLAGEERIFQEQNGQKMQVYPEMSLLLLICVEGDNHE